MVQNKRQAPDPVLCKIADYVHAVPDFSEAAINTAYLALLDSLGCLLLAFQVPECQQLLGPVVPGTQVPLGARVPGTSFELDPIKAAFDIGIGIRWLDYNDTWLAAEWGHPSDNLGGILAITDFLSRRQPHVTLQDILNAMIQAYEIQGILAVENAFNRVGLDHVILVKIASTAVGSRLLGLTKEQTIDALSNAWIDGHSLRTYRHAPNTGSRKSWAAGDATSRGLQLAYWIQQGQQGYPSALSARQWGFCDSLFSGRPIQLTLNFSSYVMENILFKVAFPAEFHAQTAVECAIALHPEVLDRLDEIDWIDIITQESAMRIINKEGPLYNAADRDHCLQYMVAIGLIFGELQAAHYSDRIAADPRIDRLRLKMRVRADSDFNRSYLDPNERAIANAVQVHFRDQTHTDLIQIEYPLGHKRRRSAALPFLKEKFVHAISNYYADYNADDRIGRLLQYWESPRAFLDKSVHIFMQDWVI